jgi:hypothetical protein
MYENNILCGNQQPSLEERKVHRLSRNGSSTKWYEMESNIAGKADVEDIVKSSWKHEVV